jgi:hypothetical protein
MTTALTPAELAAMTARAESAAAEHPGPWWWGEATDDPATSMRLFDSSEQQKQILKAPRKSVEFACYWPPKATAEFIAHSLTDVLSLAALYEASQEALTEALAELTAARAEIAQGRQLEAMFPEAGPE